MGDSDGGGYRALRTVRPLGFRDENTKSNRPGLPGRLLMDPTTGWSGQDGRPWLLVDDTVLHHEARALHDVNVLERIAGNRGDVRQLPRRERADALVPA